ncbi:dTDP-4-dehydrorhamnose 3,5-epimerase [Fervidicella metallireducens]|uniref:dTDP-4-dehydrorhamnose 3,5-epimerase n=1 Tax=Fervidicella metallireducens TaxID=655338 RepID=UPI00054EDB9C|nr:dTDP-4-dehydrorhamnose 3,5-epimerase [Fervidicella metallireducens]
MENFKIMESYIKGIYIIEPTILEDSRGSFHEVYNYNKFKKLGLDIRFVQENQSHSIKGVLRGLHFQLKYPQGKLIRVVKGEVFDVAVDIRPNSATFGKWFSCILNDVNKTQIYISEGMAHGFLVLSEEAEFVYSCTEYYHPEDENGICWNDDQIKIEWPIGKVERVILSEKDKNWGSFQEYKKLIYQRGDKS